MAWNRKAVDAGAARTFRLISKRAGNRVDLPPTCHLFSFQGERVVRRKGSRDHLAAALTAADKAATNAMGGDHLSEACAHLLFALELRERADDLRSHVNERRTR